VPIPKGVSFSTAHAITSGSLHAFTSGLDTALIIAAAIAVTAGIAAFASVRSLPPAIAASNPTVQPPPVRRTDDNSVICLDGWRAKRPTRASLRPLLTSARQCRASQYRSAPRAFHHR
jgi:hypothetical protein